MTEFDDKLKAALEQLDKEKAPERDLWTGVAHSINEPASRHATKPKPYVYPAVAASIVLFTAVLLGSRPDTVPEATLNAMQGNTLVQSISAQHEEQKSLLLTRFSQQPAVTDDWQQQLNELDDAATAVKRALAEDPDNTALLGMLQHIYQQQLLLIERVHAPRWQHI